MGGVDRKVHSFRVSTLLTLSFALTLIGALKFDHGHEHEQEHEHDYEGETDVTLSTFAYISR